MNTLDRLQVKNKQTNKKTKNHHATDLCMGRESRISTYQMTHYGHGCNLWMSFHTCGCSWCLSKAQQLPLTWASLPKCYVCSRTPAHEHPKQVGNYWSGQTKLKGYAPWGGDNEDPSLQLFWWLLLSHTWLMTKNQLSVLKKIKRTFTIFFLL